MEIGVGSAQYNAGKLLVKYSSRVDSSRSVRDFTRSFPFASLLQLPIITSKHTLGSTRAYYPSTDEGTTRSGSVRKQLGGSARLERHLRESLSRRFKVRQARDAFVQVKLNNILPARLPVFFNATGPTRGLGSRSRLRSHVQIGKYDKVV